MLTTIEEIGLSTEDHRLVSLCHYGEQNGDLMRALGTVFMVYNLPDGAAAETILIRNDHLGINQKV